MNSELAAAASHVSLFENNSQGPYSARRTNFKAEPDYERNNNHTTGVAGVGDSYAYNSGSDLELATAPQDRNWKGLFLSILVIVIVCVIVGVSAWLLQPPESGQDYKYVYDYDAMFDITWKPYSTTGKWIGGSFIYQDRFMNMIRKNGRETEIIVSNRTVDALGIYRISVSPDLKYALLAYDVTKVYRHSSTAKYYVYTISTMNHVPLHTGTLRYAGWGTTGNQIVYVLDSDIYYKNDVHAKPEQITNTGKDSDGNIVNGIPDWIYEEEVLSTNTANWMSPDGSYLAFVSFNDTEVKEVDIVLYNVPYPEVMKVKYPKTGYQNPTVQLYIYDLKSNRQIRTEVPDMLKKKEPILNSVVWATDDTALITWSNRYQNISATAVCTVSSEGGNVTQSSRIVHEQHADGWIEYIATPPVVGPPGIYFQIEERTLGGRGKFHHLLMINYTTEPSTTSSFLTTGNWEVTKIVGYDQQKDQIYFLSNQPWAGDRQLYSVSIRGQSSPICITCGRPCKYTKAQMSPNSTGVYLECLGPNVPYFSVLDVETNEESILESNYELKEKVENAKMPTVLFNKVTIEGENGEYELEAKLYLPSTHGKGKLPLLVNLYAGPGSQEVNSKFQLDWKTYLTTNHDIAVMMFDGRGSGFRGSNVLKAVNRRLGVYEIEDQITAINQVLEKHPYLDRDRIAISGWSYGGYASAMVATHPKAIKDNLIKCAISVAPVTDWRLYDSIYTERYLGSPVYNYNRYMEASLLSRAEFFKSFKYLLIHGTRDDNVHFQNSAVLETALVREGVVHRYQVYTDETHSLSNELKWTQRHLYKLMTEYLEECFEKP